MHLISSSLETQVDTKITFRPYLNKLHRHHKALGDIVSYLDKNYECLAKLRECLANLREGLSNLTGYL